MVNPRDKYRNDVYFRKIVNMIISLLDSCEYTPSELREAVVLASIIYHERHSSPIMFNPEIKNFLDGKIKA